MRYIYIVIPVRLNGWGEGIKRTWSSIIFVVMVENRKKREKKERAREKPIQIKGKKTKDKINEGKTIAHSADIIAVICGYVHCAIFTDKHLFYDYYLFSWADNHQHSRCIETQSHSHSHTNIPNQRQQTNVFVPLRFRWRSNF